MSADEVTRLRQENADLREYIAAAREVAEARACTVLQEEIADLRTRCSEAIKTLVDSSRIEVGHCPYCDEMWPTAGCDRARVRELALEHDRRCPQNPMRADLDALRTALIEVADRQVRRFDELLQIRAIRAAANDTGTPFSEGSIKTRLEGLRERAAVIRVEE